MVANTTWAAPGFYCVTSLSSLFWSEVNGSRPGSVRLHMPELDALGIRLRSASGPGRTARGDACDRGKLFDTGVANLDGRFVTAHHLPLSPRPGTSTRLLVGGGSDRVAELAGRSLTS